MLAVTAAVAYVPAQWPVFGALIVGLVFIIVNLPSISIWLAFGAGLRRFLADPVKRRWFNWSMAALLVASLWPMVRPLLPDWTPMTTHLSDNVNAIAQLRNRRKSALAVGGGLSRIALDAGAAGITCIRVRMSATSGASDVPVLKALVAGYARPVEFKHRGLSRRGVPQYGRANRPHQVTLVPDEPGQAPPIMLDIAANDALLRRVIARLKAGGMRVSLFVDADPAAIAARQGCRRGPRGIVHRPLWRHLCRCRSGGPSNCASWKRGHAAHQPGSGSMPA